MKKLFKNGNIILEDRILSQTDLLVQDGRIEQIAPPIAPPDAAVIDCTGLTIAPGFIDIHVHGGGGGDFMDESPESLLRILQTHTAHGTTSLFPTTLACGIEDTLRAVRRIEAFAKQAPPTLCRMVKVHLEGPYFNVIHKGAQPEEYIQIPHRDTYTRLLAPEIVGRISFAPEIENALELAEYAVNVRGIVGAIAHTNAAYEDIIAVYDRDVRLLTHLYSAMPVVHRVNGYRKIGVAETSFLLDEMFVEVIGDGKHLPRELLRLIYKIKGPDRIVLITDAMRAAGQSVTESYLGSQEQGVKVCIRDDVAFMPDGQNFAGSIATMDRVVRNMVELADVPLVDAIRMASLTPAKAMRIDSDTGSITPGKRADLVLLDQDLHVRKTFVGGRETAEI